MNDIQLTETALLILSTMHSPIHGYDIMKRIDEALHPLMSVGPATMYTTLSKLVKSKLCTLTEDQHRKIYTLTPLGQEVLAGEITRREKMLDFMKKQHNTWRTQ
jgi:DNA-binding PadR family transcriptional regulator